MLKSSLILAAGVLAGASFIPFVERVPPQDAKEDMGAMMAKAKVFMQPGKAHKALERFLGKWDTETRMFMSGQTMPPTKGTAEFSWLMDGRWLKGERTATFMGQTMQTFSIMGYDNFKKSYVSSQVSTFDTAMIHYEGDMDPGDKALISYGTLDEYLTGEVGKMVKTVWRFPSPDKMILEVHDLPIGEQNTKVFEVTFTKKS